jgi:hypothetical protein
MSNAGHWGLRALVACATVWATLASAHELATGIMPTGPSYAASRARPAATLGDAACSPTRPVCVHASSRYAPVLAALEALEKADALLSDVLGLPRPLEDGALGGTPAFDLYLVEPMQGRAGSDRIVTERDEPRAMTWDRASAFALLDRTVTGCALGNLVARGYASAIGWGIDAADPPPMREARAAHVAELVAPCGTITAELIDASQRHPELSVSATSAEVGPALGILFPWFLDDTLGDSVALPSFGLSAVGPQRTPEDSLLWLDEPDLFDALRPTLEARADGLRAGDALLRFAVARLFVGDRSDDGHRPLVAWPGTFGRVRFDATVPFASLPRRVVPRTPIEPTGSTFIWIDLAGAKPHSRFAFHVDWESPVLFRWTIVRIGQDGRELSSVPVVTLDRTTSAERNVEDLDGLAGLAIVGVNAGDLGPRDPFDPDQTPFEPHGYVATLVANP